MYKIKVIENIIICIKNLEKPFTKILLLNLLKKLFEKRKYLETSLISIISLDINQFNL